MSSETSLMVQKYVVLYSDISWQGMPEEERKLLYKRNSLTFKKFLEYNLSKSGSWTL